LGVSRVYDFRRDDEVKAGRLEIDGVRVMACPYKDGAEKPLPIVVSDFAPSEDGEIGEGYRKMYDDILTGYTTGFRLVFEGLCAMEEGEAVLFHCTGKLPICICHPLFSRGFRRKISKDDTDRLSAGKDRTGVMSALILDLMGVPAERIGLEYALTRIGTEPFREKLLPVALKSYGSATTATPGATEGNVDKKEGQGGFDLSSPGLREALGTNAAVMVDFIDHLQRKYGGAKGYMMGQLGFSEEEVGQIRDRLKARGGEEAT
jgi:hypothetical protein